MKKQHGYTLIETLIAMLIVAALGASGLYGWQRWQQQQRLWQTAIQVRDYLLQLREDANWRNRDHVISVIRDGTSCVLSALLLCKPRVYPFRPWFLHRPGRCRNGRDNAFTGLFWSAQYGMGWTYSPEKYDRGMARGGVRLGANQALRER